MANDAFISYSANDRLVADSICAALEAEGVKCWMAPRDILPSEKYSQSIINALGESRLMILVFSASANESDHVISEVDRAYNKRKPIIPVRIEDVPPSPGLEYYLSPAQWQDALPPPIQKHLPKLVGTVKLILKRLSESAMPPDQTQAASLRPVPSEDLSPTVEPRLTSKFKFVILVCSILAIGALSYLGWKIYQVIRASGPESSPASSPASARNQTSESTSTSYEDVTLLYNQGFSGIDVDNQGNIYWVESFSGNLGTFDVARKSLTVLVSDLNGPEKIRISGNRAYFIETGTEEKRYKDGSLSFLDLSSNRVHKLLDNLNYPNGLWVTLLNDVYFTEAGGGSTSFGGVNQLSVLRSGSTKQVVITDQLRSPTCVASNTTGLIYVGDMGESSPGDTGFLELILWDYENSAKVKVKAKNIIVDKLSTPQDMALDRYGNIYLAGFGKSGNFNGVTLIPSTSPHKAVPLKMGVPV